MTENSKKMRIAISLKRTTLEYFKKLAMERKVRYQDLISKVLEEYVKRYNK